MQNCKVPPPGVYSVITTGKINLYSVETWPTPPYPSGQGLYSQWSDAGPSQTPWDVLRREQQHRACGSLAKDVQPPPNHEETAPTPMLEEQSVNYLTSILLKSSRS